MKAITVADKLISTGRIFILSALITLPLNAQAEYYLVYGPPAVPVACDSCQSPRPYYRPVHKVHRTHRVKVCKTHTYKKCYHHNACKRRSHYNVTVYYPVPVYTPAPCGSCGGYLEPTYYWTPAPYEVYYARPEDRLVGNRYEENYYDPSLDTGTADNDIY